MTSRKTKTPNKLGGIKVISIINTLKKCTVFIKGQKSNTYLSLINRTRGSTILD